MDQLACNSNLEEYQELDMTGPRRHSSLGSLLIDIFVTQWLNRQGGS